MTDQTKPGQGATPEPAVNATTMEMLVQLLLAERQQALEDRQERQRTQKARDDQRKINAEYAVAEKNKIQAICTHKKGGKGLKGPRIDYAVYAHTFTDNIAYIRCQICGAKWRRLDTVEYLVRSGKQIENHTGIGWKEALNMLSQSTNTPSSSEIQMAAQPIATSVADLA